MPTMCCVLGCGSIALRDEVSFYRIPSIYNQRKQVDPLRVKRRQLWLQAIKRDDFTEAKFKHATVCSRHFVRKTAALKDQDDPDWVPSIDMGYPPEIKDLKVDIGLIVINFFVLVKFELSEEAAAKSQRSEATTAVSNEVIIQDEVE
ncbi:hypothetical protein NQ314_015214 [Rhamnusium bicolor]|uniref:THAP-type domain-containing protein n=1 Tax=Rhamnusium bicolor TaxID=1586634 RepID=A0AAV8WZF1_9CUCU|nr:hypothetical protein NQ314_015214 [Rhamnusium bicolor]